jgi:uncharacterized membrane protein
MKKTTIIILGIIITSFALGILLYPSMPERMASHWNLEGNVNGYISKFWGVFLMPLLSLLLLAFFLIIPLIDPMRENIKKFRAYFDRFVIIIIAFLFYLYILTLLWNMGYAFDMVLFLTPAFGVLFYYVGILTENARMNWFIGIRTPWTLSSERVWEKTHKIGGKMFKISGALAFLGILFRDYMLLFILLPIIAATVYLVLYSYFEFKKEQPDKKPIGMKMMKKKRK